VTRLLTIKFPLSFPISEKLGLTRAQAENHQDLVEQKVAFSVRDIFSKVGQSAGIIIKSFILKGKGRLGHMNAGGCAWLIQ